MSENDNISSFITSEIMGGLGNQLFQIFNLINYSLENNAKFYIPLKQPDKKERPFYWENFLVNLKPYLISEEKLNKYILQIFNQYSFEYIPIPILNPGTSCKLNGYFQSHLYFDKHKEDIYKIIKLDEFRRNYINDYDYSNTICLHFRLGDYIHLQHHHPLISKRYYLTSLNDLIKKLNNMEQYNTIKKNWKVIYFCEDNEHDIKYVHNMLSEIDKELEYDRNIFKLSFEKIDKKYQDWEQLLIMSLCKHNIIANSTFSWFGAYFNDNKYKQVYYPSVWFGPGQGNKNTKYLFPDNWIRIDC
jgi:hypothetical protein